MCCQTENKVKPAALSEGLFLIRQRLFPKKPAHASGVFDTEVIIRVTDDHQRDAAVQTDTLVGNKDETD